MFIFYFTTVEIIAQTHLAHQIIYVRIDKFLLEIKNVFT